jgi:hypothetical protein
LPKRRETPQKEKKWTCKTSPHLFLKTFIIIEHNPLKTFVLAWTPCSLKTHTHTHLCQKKCEEIKKIFLCLLLEKTQIICFFILSMGWILLFFLIHETTFYITLITFSS